MAALDLLGRRWVLRILWELRAGPLGFRALQAACDSMSSSVLSARLTDLVAAGIVAADEQGGYALTDLGQRLEVALAPLTEWSADWARTLDG
jgi:DNA-binding HxlR family transcriptional regulator